MLNCTPWFKCWQEYRTNPKLQKVAEQAGVCLSFCRDVFWFCLDKAREAGRTGKVPDPTRADAVALGAAGCVSAETVLAVIELFRTEGLIDTRGRIYRWKDMQLSDEEKKRRQAESDRVRSYYARKKAEAAGKSAPEPKPEPAPKPAPAPAPTPKPTPKPKRESKPKQDVKAPQPGHSAALLPGLVASPAPAPKRPSMSEAEKRQLFDEFWAAGGDPSQSPNGAWSYWKKLVWTKEKAAELTAAIGRAQALQDARGLSRYNVPKWFREHGYEAEACTSEEAFQAALSKAHAPRRGGKPIPGGVSDAFHMVDRLASRMGWGAPAENISDGGTAVPPQRGEYYDCEFTVVSSAAC